MALLLAFGETLTKYSLDGDGIGGGNDRLISLRVSLGRECECEADIEDFDSTTWGCWRFDDLALFPMNLSGRKDTSSNRLSLANSLNGSLSARWVGGGMVSCSELRLQF